MFILLLSLLLASAYSFPLSCNNTVLPDASEDTDNVPRFNPERFENVKQDYMKGAWKPMPNHPYPYPPPQQDWWQPPPPPPPRVSYGYDPSYSGPPPEIDFNDGADHRGYYGRMTRYRYGGYGRAGTVGYYDNDDETPQPTQSTARYDYYTTPAGPIYNHWW